ncbi:S-norcoclaurine synthase 1 isoform X2 [Morus notabilis]|uniref:S-norcoclaurine synthase 1 isoform X2 n=1 Tax=Morus notabilis TaxID=981085 RepID=UPI000CECEEA4|nr:S-norcoclaurine synthase 1 isoform X2 [Morus notabilis]
MEAHEELRREIGDGSGSAVNAPVVLDNVETLSSKKLKEIPHYYLQPRETENDLVEVVDNAFLIPVIDMTKLLDQHSSGHRDELARLHSACRDWGFFQLINHGVPEEIVEKMKIDTEEFFQLPLEKKKAYAQLPNGFEGYGQAFVFSEEQKLDWVDRLFLDVRHITKRNVRFWPTHPTSFRENLDKYSLEMQKLTICLLKFMSRNLGLDAETFTIQVNDVQGLQVKKNGKWVPVKPVPGAFIVNIGDLIEIMTNGEYKSVEHRVVVNSKKHRLSIGAFLSPDFKTIIGPVPGLVKQNGPNYKSIIFEDYLEQVYRNKKINSKSLIDQMKLEK